MNKLMLLLLSFFIVPVAQAGVQIGELAPDFSLTDTYGDDHSLSDYQGNYVVLEWCNHDCPFVRKHYNSGNMQALQKKYTANNVVWLTIGSSASGKQGHFDPGVWNNLTEEKDATPTAVLLDPAGDVGRAYGAKTTPHMYVIDPEGNLIYQGAIDSIASADPSDIEDSDNYIETALDESMAGDSISTPSTRSYGCSIKY